VIEFIHDRDIKKLKKKTRRINQRKEEIITKYNRKRKIRLLFKKDCHGSNMVRDIIFVRRFFKNLEKSILETGS